MVLHFAATSEAGSAPAISHWDCGLFHVVVWQTNDTTAQVACQLHHFPDVPNFFFCQIRNSAFGFPLHINISLNCRPSQDPR